MNRPGFPIHLFEEHASTLPVWWADRGTPRTVVYLDAHLDLQRLAESQIEALQRCLTTDEIQALEAPSHLDQSSDYAYGIENFLYAAGRLGLIDRLICVTPPHIPRHYSESLLAYLQQMDGVSFEELTGFKEIRTGILRGRLLGLDITLCDYQQLGALELAGDYDLDIDIDYFVKVPEDRLWTDPGQVIHAILAQLGPPRIATVSRAVGSGFTPLPMRFIGDYIVAVLAETETSEKHYHQLYLALQALSEQRAEAARLETSRAVEARPACAASCFTHALVLEQLGDASAREFRQRAARIDEHYAFDLGRAASGFPNRRRALSAQQLQHLVSQLPGEPEQRHELDSVALARLYAAREQPGNALHLLRPHADRLSRYPDILLEIAVAVMKSDQADKATPLLEIACGSEKTRSMATLYLGDLALAQGDPLQALQAYRKVSEFAPAWLLPLEKQLECYRRLGDTQAQRRIGDRLAQRRQILAGLLPPESG